MDLLFQLFLPVRCSGCRIYESSGFCLSCQSKLPKNPILFSIPPILEGVALSFYSPPIEQTIHDLKFKHQKILGWTLGQLMGKAVQKRDWDFHCIAPVPMEKKKWKKRGYNQAEVLARGMSKVLGRPCRNILEVLRSVSHQVGLGRKERLENVREAFGVSQSETISKRSFLLVDDVVTTGATLSECAAVLIKNGAEKVYAACAARHLLSES
ncbi:MAG: ComF family protein [Firmicutes bacterium]|nr:ComF family protein [Bacillota bacterium]